MGNLFKNIPYQCYSCVSVLHNILYEHYITTLFGYPGL